MPMIRERMTALLKGRSPIDLVFASMTALAAFTVCLIMLGVFVSLVRESSLSINKFGAFSFMFSSDWDPVKELFGAAASIFGTAVTTALALFFAVPIGIGIAVFVTEIAPDSLKGTIGAAIELLAAIPSIVYGMWGLFTLAPLMGKTVEPFMQKIFGGIPVVGHLFSGNTTGIDMFTSSVVLSIMVVPFIASVSRDSFNQTPSILKESAYGVGATRWEVIRDVVIPYSKRGVFGGAVLSLGRALGETMAVAFVLGNSKRISLSLFDAASTITVTLANEFTEADTDMYLSALYHLALILFTLSFITLAVAKFFINRKTEEHDR
ncbi:MAG: phosphate ABC transporter permease subunit PstC [Nitrospirae bacterium]|nr:phosphate ABC transporter permease subunit PstC [Nitrospirota bacterium]